MVAENMKDYATAARMLASVPKEVQKQRESIGALAVSYYHLGEREKARNTLAELREYAIGQHPVLLGAEIADQNADYETAEGFLLSIRNDNPDQADLGFRLATVQYHARKFDQSEQTLLQLISTGNTTAETFNLLGWCYQQLGQDELAIHAFEQAISLLPHEESNYLDLEEVLAIQNNIVAALKVAKRATDACPRSPRVFISRGELEVRASQFADAVASYHEATVLDPHDADALLGSADSEYAADMREEAYDSFETGLRQHPKDARFPLHYASALLKEGETGDTNSQLRAAALLKSAVSLDPSSADAHYQLGEIDLKEGRTTDALLEYRKAARLEPKNPKIHFGLSKVYRRLGRVEEASREAKLFEELKEAKPAASTALPGEPH
jgi:tetratricopeptide (TPR) repeat protein